MNNKTLFIWDFHGTLETGNVYAVQEMINLVLKEMGINKEISIDQTKEWYGVSWFNYFKLTVPEGGDDSWHEMVDRVLALQQRGWDLIKQHIQLREYADDVLKTIKDNGHHNILLSNTRLEHLPTFTDFLNITPYFEELIAADSHQNSSNVKTIDEIKSEIIADFIKNKQYQKIVVIGDKESDILAGKSFEAVAYLIADKQPDITRADHVITDLRKVLQEIEIPARI